MRSFDTADAAPRRDRRRRHVLPCLSIVGGQLNDAVVGADPDHVRVHRGWTDGIDDPALTIAVSVFCRDWIEAGGNTWIRPRQVRTDLRPCLRAVGGTKKKLTGVIERVRIRFREHEWLRPVGSRRLRTRGNRSGKGRVQLEVVPRAETAEHDAWMQRIAGGHPAFAARPIGSQSRMAMVANFPRDRTATAPLSCCAPVTQ